MLLWASLLVPIWALGRQDGEYYAQTTTPPFKITTATSESSGIERYSQFTSRMEDDLSFKSLRLRLKDRLDPEPFGPLPTVSAGLLFTMTNAKKGNEVLVFFRDTSNHLTKVSTVSTGGQGASLGEPGHPLGSQQPLVLSNDHRFLLAVNAGNNTISVFKVLPKAPYLDLVYVADSGGKFPTSIALGLDDMVYVLNAAQGGSVAAFTLGYNGKLREIEGQRRDLHAAVQVDSPPLDTSLADPRYLNCPGQIGLTPGGEFLVVSVKALQLPTGYLLFYALDRHGHIAEEAYRYETGTKGPFAFTFDLKGRLLNTEANGTKPEPVGFVSVYSIDTDVTDVEQDPYKNFDAQEAEDNLVMWSQHKDKLILVDVVAQSVSINNAAEGMEGLPPGAGPKSRPEGQWQERQPGGGGPGRGGPGRGRRKPRGPPPQQPREPRFSFDRPYPPRPGPQGQPTQPPPPPPRDHRSVFEAFKFKPSQPTNRFRRQTQGVEAGQQGAADVRVAANGIVATQKAGESEQNYAYVSSNVGGSVSSYRITEAGISLLQTRAAWIFEGQENGHPLDMVLGGEVLYVLTSSLGKIYYYQIEDNGDLTKLGEAGGLPVEGGLFGAPAGLAFVSLN